MKKIAIAVGVIEEQGTILVTGRQAKDCLRSEWEFPGGKLEAHEEPQQALERELHEELGISVQKTTPLITTFFSYPHMQVTIHAYRIDDYQGQITANEGQAIKWVSKEHLSSQGLLEASWPIIQAFTLPHNYLITPSGQTIEQLEQLISQAVQTTPSLMVQYRDNETSNYKKNASRLIALGKNIGCTVVLNSSIETAQELEAEGAHLNRHRIAALKQKPEGLLVGGSCHNLEEIELANQLKLDWLVLSPVLKTQSHPNTSPLGWDKFAQLTQTATMPVYALGGTSQKEIEKIQHCGGQGIAGIRCFY